MLWVGLSGCEEGRRVASERPTHTLIYTGDLMLGRSINDALWDEEPRRLLLGEVAPLLRGADLTVVNGEGVISNGGDPPDKGESRPYLYRASPAIVPLLVDAGIDVVTVGNNHAGDYGPAALGEMLDHLQLAGLAYTGGGHDLDDARRPTYHRLGELVVALVGADLTIASAHAATPTSPGVFWLPGLQKGKAPEVAEALRGPLGEARKYAQVVLFTPHWGDNFTEGPSDLTRRLARRIIALGYDAILGHSAHQVHGVELIDGKPVLYDAGNLVLDFGGGGPTHRGLAYELVLSEAGVESVIAHPLDLGRNTVRPGAGRNRDILLNDWKDASLSMQTEVTIDDGIGRLTCAPGRAFGPEALTEVPVRPLPSAVRLAPDRSWVDQLPDDATPLAVSWAPGIHLLGYRLWTEALSVPKGGQVIELYLRADGPLTERYAIRLQADGTSKNGAPAVERADHTPGDWLWPTDRWRAGGLLRDWTLVRMQFQPTGEVRFSVGLLLNGRRVAVVASERPIVDELVELGRATYVPGTPRVLALRGAAAVAGDEAKEGDAADGEAAGGED
jgi:poly-gamma-glutamate capsule biosynthesis protein CapA/YwtB (metallophosphatase superfamily)